MEWNYAALSKMAKVNGGPDRFVEFLIKSGAKKVLPWIVVAFAGGIALGIALTVGVQKIFAYFSQNKAISAAEVESAKKELIQGINDYDVAQTTIENEHKQDVETNETPVSDTVVEAAIVAELYRRQIASGLLP